MVKHTQTNCLNVFDHFVRLALKGLNNSFSHNSFSGNLRQTLKKPVQCRSYAQEKAMSNEMNLEAFTEKQ